MGRARIRLETHQHQYKGELRRVKTHLLNSIGLLRHVVMALSIKTMLNAKNLGKVKNAQALTCTWMRLIDPKKYLCIA